MSKEDGSISSAEKLGPDTIEGLGALEKLLEILRSEGSKVGEKYALPTDSEIQEEIDNHLSTIADTLEVEVELLPLSVEPLLAIRPELVLPFDGEEKTTLEQRKEIGDLVLGLKRETDLKERLLSFGQGKGRRDKKCFVHLPNLPKGHWQDVLATENVNRAGLTIQYNKDGSPNSWTLDLVEQTRFRDGGGSIIPSGHPLSNVKSIVASQSGDAFWIRTFYELDSGRKRVVSPSPGRGPLEVGKELVGGQAEALIELLTLPK